MRLCSEFEIRQNKESLSPRTIRTPRAIFLGFSGFTETRSSRREYDTLLRRCYTSQNYGSFDIRSRISEWHLWHDKVESSLRSFLSLNCKRNFDFLLIQRYLNLLSIPRIYRKEEKTNFARFKKVYISFKLSSYF